MTLVSSDTHVVEPPDLWTTRMPQKLKDQAPCVIHRDDGDWWQLEGRQRAGFSSAQLGVRFERPEELSSLGHRFEQVRSGGFQPQDHVADMDADGVDASILYPTAGLVLYSMENSDLLTAACSAYNDWIAEFCDAIPGRAYGIAMINLNNIDEAIKECKRARDMHLSGVVLAVAMLPENRYFHEKYDPLWATLEELEMPGGLHTGAFGRGMSSLLPTTAQYPQTARTNVEIAVRESLSDMIFSGVFDRHPRLQIGAVEYELGWVPYFLQRMDYTYTQRQDNATWYHLANGALPSDVFRKNCFCGFQDDPSGIRERDFIGVDTIMWGSDYPHAESTWPYSREITRKRLEGVSPSDQRKITFENVSRVYKIAIPSEN